MRQFLRNNGLSVVLFAFFAVFLAGQSLVGFRVANAEREDHNQPAQSYGEYLASPSFLEATMENWESEFLQMAAFVLLTVRLYQRGSAESKDPDKREEVDEDPDPTRPDAPAPVRQGGWRLALYKHSLSLTLLALFAVSFVLHAVGGAGEYNEEQMEHNSPERVTVLGYMATSRFWFESLQNWQSEFLAILAMVVLTIFLREHGSAESKPVNAPHSTTGEG